MKLSTEAVPTAAPMLAAMAGVFLLSLMDAVVKGVSGSVPTWQIVLLRYAFGVAFALPLFLAGDRHLPRGEVLRAHAMRAVAIVTTAATFFYALSALPLVVTLALSFTAPIMIALLARMTLGERPSIWVWGAIAVGFLGVLVVLVGEVDRSGTATIWGVLAALVAAGSYAVSMVSLKARAGRDSIPTIVFLQNAAAMLLVAPFGVWSWTPVSTNVLLWFVLIGLLGTAGHIVLAWAYGRADASRLGSVEYTAFLWATLLGLVFFGEVPSPATIAGAILIMAGAVLAMRSSRMTDA